MVDVSFFCDFDQRGCGLNGVNSFQILIQAKFEKCPLPCYNASVSKSPKDACFAPSELPFQCSGRRRIGSGTCNNKQGVITLPTQTGCTILSEIPQKFPIHLHQLWSSPKTRAISWPHLPLPPKVASSNLFFFFQKKKTSNHLVVSIHLRRRILIHSD